MAYWAEASTSNDEFLGNLVMNASQSAKGKVESEEDGYHAEDDVFKDLEKTAPVPSRQRMMDFRKLEKHSGKI